MAGALRRLTPRLRSRCASHERYARARAALDAFVSSETVEIDLGEGGTDWRARAETGLDDTLYLTRIGGGIGSRSTARSCVEDDCGDMTVHDHLEVTPTGLQLTRGVSVDGRCVERAVVDLTRVDE